MTGQAMHFFLQHAKSPFENREAIHLLFSANRWAVAEKMRTDLATGISVIADRYSFSGVAYSQAKGLDKAWSRSPEVGLPKPDIVLFFDVDPLVAAARRGYGDEAFEKTDFQTRVYGRMKEIFVQPYSQVSC